MIWQEVPEGFSDLEPYELAEHFEGLSLTKIPGKCQEWIFLSVMLHGNEPCGLRVAQSIYKKYDGVPPRGLILLIGNVEAAKNGMRRLDSQPDYNRIWLGGKGEQFQRGQQVLKELSSMEFFAGVDIHNNTGKNPPYACINKLRGDLAQMAKRFSKVCVYFQNPREALSHQLSELMAGITIECGLPNDKQQEEKAFHFIDELMHLDKLQSDPPREDEIDIYHSYTRLVIPETCTVSFSGDDNADFNFYPHFDDFNFRMVKVGESVGHVTNNRARIVATGEDGRDLSNEYFSYEGGVIRFKRACVPSMFTQDVQVIHQDCLGYLMEEVSVELLTSAGNKFF